MREHPSFEAIKSIPQLLTERKTSVAAWTFFQAAATEISTQESKTLVARIETTTDPLLLWQLHEELDRREVPPAFRWPVNGESAQMEFISWLADLHWFTRRKPGHKAEYSRWQRWFLAVSESWHVSALRAYTFAFKRGRVATYFAKGLALSERDRRELMTMKTVGQIARLRPLRKHAHEYQHAILAYARAKPDKSGSTTPEEVMRRRYAMWRLYLLADGSETAAARQYHNLYGEPVARQNLSKQIELAQEAWRIFGPLSKNPDLSGSTM